MTINPERERGQMASPQSFIITFSYPLRTLGTLVNCKRTKVKESLGRERILGVYYNSPHSFIITFS